MCRYLRQESSDNNTVYAEDVKQRVPDQTVFKVQSDLGLAAAFSVKLIWLWHSRMILM